MPVAVGAARETSILVCPATPEHPRQSEASLVPLADGRLLLAYSDFYGGDWHDAGPARIAGRWSTDGGRSWSEPFVLQENIGRVNCMSASLLRLPEGRLLLAFGCKDEEGVRLHALVKSSGDGGRTWSEPRPLTAGAGYWCMTNDRLARLSSGRILYPVEAPGAGCLCWYSDDGGASWRKSARGVEPPAGVDYEEPAVVERPDGQVAMYIRTNTGNFHIALSGDGGETWRMHKSHPPDMCGHPDSGPNAARSPCQLKRVPDTKDLLMVWNNNRVRTPLTAAISSDGGETWRHLRNLEEMDGWPPRLTHAYASVAFQDEDVHLTYWETHSDPSVERLVHLRYRRLPRSWFYA